MAEILTPWEAFLVDAPIFDDTGCLCEGVCTCHLEEDECSPP